MDINSNSFLSSCVEDRTVDATPTTNNEVELTLVDATMTAACKVESTKDIVTYIKTSDSHGLFGIQIITTV